MNPVRRGGEISYAVERLLVKAVEVIYNDRTVCQSAVHKCHAQLPCAVSGKALLGTTHGTCAWQNTEAGVLAQLMLAWVEGRGIGRC